MTEEKRNTLFKEKVLENPMFDNYDKQIIMNHLSNFYCVFELGFDEGVKETLIKQIGDIKKAIEEEIKK